MQPRGRDCSQHGTLRWVGRLDDGTGLFVEKTRIIVGTAVARVWTNHWPPHFYIQLTQPYFTNLYHMRDDITATIHNEMADEFEDYIEFNAGDLFV